MASATGVDSPSALLLPDSIPLLDLRLLSQSELFSLSLFSSFQPDGRCGDDDVLIPKIDRSVFNESAGSRKQTYSRLRLAPRNSQFPSSSSSASSRHPSEPFGQETFQVIALLKQLFSSSGTNDDLVPIGVHYNDTAVLPAPSVAVPAVRNVPIHAVLPNSAPEKRKRGRPRKNATGGLRTPNSGNPLPVSSSPISYGFVGNGVSAPVSSNSAFSVNIMKRKRGRPRKNVVPETERTVTGMVSVPISSNAALHGSATDIFSVPVSSNAVSHGSAGEVPPIAVSFDSALSDDAKKRKPGSPIKNQETILCCPVTGSLPVPVSSNAVPRDYSAKIISVPVSSNEVVLNSEADIAGSVSLGKRKRGRPRKNKNHTVPIVKNQDKAVTLCDHAKEIVEKKEELVNVNRNEGVVNLVAFGSSEDPFGAELRRRTEALKTEAELLGFLGRLEGEWGSWRRKKKMVPASELGDTLPRGWKIQISLKRREGHVSLFCRRYLSPNGQQFVSCKEVFSFLRASSGVQAAGQSKPGLADNNVQVADKVGSGDGENLSFEDAKKTDVPVSCSRVPITFVSTGHGEQAILLETRNLGEVQIGTDEGKPSSLETNDEVSVASIHGKLGADTLTEVCTDRQRADTASRIDGGSGGLVSFFHVEKVKNGSKDEKHQEYCEEQDNVCCMSDKNELDKLYEAIKVGETASSNKKNGNSFEISDGTSISRCALSSTSPEEPKINVDPGTGLLASSTDKKMCSTADHKFTRRVEDRNGESTSSHCRRGCEEKCGPVRDENCSPTSIMMGSACDRSSELGLSSSSIDGRICIISNDNNIFSSVLYQSNFPNDKMINSGSNRVTSGSEAVINTEHDKSSGSCLRVPPSNERSFITGINSDISNFKMEEPWDDSGFESSVFTSFDNDDSVNKSSFGTVEMSKVDDAGICKGSSDFSVAFDGKDTGMYANPVSCMEQVGNFGGGSHIFSSYESKYKLRDSLVSDRQMGEVKQDGSSLDFHMLGRSDYSQSCNFIDDVNNIFSSSMEESGNKEVKSFWNNEVLHALDIIGTGTDANAGTNTVKGRSSEGFSSVISQSDQTFPKKNNVSGCSSKAEELKLKTCSDIGLTDVPDDMKGVSNSTLWEQPRPEDTDKSRNNDLMTGSVNHSLTYGDTTPELICRTNEQNFQPSRLVDTSSASMQLSGCFPNFNIMSEKDAYGDLNVNERFEDISDLEGLGLGSTKQSQYNFLTAQGTLNSSEPKGLSHAEIKQGFDSSFWLANESLTLFPKAASGHQTITICIWCRTEFYHEGVVSGTKSDSMNLMCATCQAKFPE